MASTRKIFLNSLSSSKSSVSTGAKDIAALDADCPKIVNYFGGFPTRKPTPTRTPVSRGEPLVSGQILMRLKHEF